MAKSDTNELISLIFTATSIVRKHAAGSVSSISLVQLKVLSMLSAHELLTMKEIADMLYIAPPSATALVNHLIKEKAAERIFDRNDRRLVRLKITPKGMKLLEKRRKEASERMNEILSRLDSKEKNELTNILKKLIKSYSR